MKDKFIKGNKASEILGVHQRTLYQWEEKGWIETKRTKGGMRLYNVDKYLREEKEKNDNDKDIHIDDCDELDKMCKKNKKISINYVRVSSVGQKDDLLRQEKMIKKEYPNNITIKDIGSGINMNRRGLRKIIDLAIAGKIDKVIVVHKDRLTRFGYELIVDLIEKYSDGEVIVISKKKDVEPEEELVKDVLQIMNVFVAKMNGMRKYGKRKKKDKNKKNNTTKNKKIKIKKNN
jgi:predicted site-specific integrase-resolvase